MLSYLFAYFLLVNTATIYLETRMYLGQVTTNDRHTVNARGKFVNKQRDNIEEDPK